MESASLQEDFKKLKNHYFCTNASCDWRRFDFSRNTVLKLRECAENVRNFPLKFTRMEHPELNMETMELMHAIEFEIRRRPLQEQYPEMWEPLKHANESLQHANETIRQIVSMQKEQQERLTKITDIECAQIEQKGRLVEISGWQKHFDNHLEPVFTNLALNYLTKRNPKNKYCNVFEDGQISSQWKNPDFQLDGLIYDETDHIFYIVEAKFYLTESQLSKTVTTLDNFCHFVAMERPNANSDENRKASRRWDMFFGDAGVVKAHIVQQPPTVSVFLGFHSSDSEYLLSMAREKSFMLMGPDGMHYKVLDE